MQLSSFWAETPTATRCVVSLHAMMSLLAWLVPFFGRVFELSLWNCSRGWLFPIATFWVVTPLSGNPVMGLLTLVLSSLAALVYLTKLERELSTLRFAAWVLTNAAVIGAGHLLLMAFSALLMSSAWSVQCAGLWPLLVIVITRRFVAESETAIQSLWGVVQIQARWYPLAIIAFFSLISMRLQFDMLIAWCVGVAVHHAEGGKPLHPALAPIQLPLHMILPSLTTVAQFEDSVSMSGGQVLGGGKEPLPQQLKRLPTNIAREISRRCPASLARRYIGATNPSVNTKPVGGNVSSSQKFSAFGGPGHTLGDGIPMV